MTLRISTSVPSASPLVGELGLETPPGALGPPLGLGSDEAPAGQDPPDGGHRRHRSAAAPMPPLQVVVDGVGAGVDPEVGQLLSEGDDSSSIAAGTRVGEERGRLDCGFRPSSPKWR